MSSFECSACGETISETRRAQHEELWCEAIVSDDDSTSVDNNNDNFGPGELVVMAHDLGDLNTKVHKITHVKLSSGLELSFEEISVFSSGTSTGGALWKSELLLAEWVIREVTGGVVVLELGCGACPAAGMAAAAMGAVSIMSDKAEVVKLAEVNLRRNSANVGKARGGKGATMLARENFDSVVYEWGGSVPARLSSIAAISVVLIGDCIFSKKTHVKLLQAITQLLRMFRNARVLLAFQRRGTEEADFFEVAKEDFNLSMIGVDDVVGLKAKLDGSTLDLEICELITSY